MRRRGLIAAAVVAAVLVTGIGVNTVPSEPDLAGSAAARGGPSPRSTAMEGSELFVAAPTPSPLDVVGQSGQPFAGAVSERIPERVDQLWRFRIDGATDRPAGVAAVVDVIDSRFVAVIAGASDAGAKQSTLSLVDAVNGAAQWSAELGLWPESFDIIGASGSTLMIESPIAERRVVGYDLATGDERWAMSESANRLDQIGSSAGFELLAGTGVLARRPSLATNPTVLFDPATGIEVGQFPGEIVGTDHLGTYYVQMNGAIARFGLSGGLYPSAMTSLPGEQPGDLTTVVDGKVVLVRDGEISVSSALAPEFALATEAPVPVRDTETPGDDGGRVTLPGSIASVEPMIGPTMIVSGSGRIVGAELDGNEIRPAWRRDGVAVRTVQTERGTVILVSRAGGSTQTLVDGSTGRTITLLTMTPGVFDNLQFARNGVLTRRTSGDGSRLSAVDLDGRETWSLAGSEPVVLGDGIVVRTEISTDEAAIVAYGEAPELS